MLGIIKSFNPKFYKKITNQSVLRSLGFLVLFVLLFSALISFKYTQVIKNMLPQALSWTQEQFKDIVSDLPQIEIKDGQTVLPQEPYLKKWNGKFALIIEPKKENSDELFSDYPNAIILTQKNLAIKSQEEGPGRSQIKIYDLKKIKQLKITPQESTLKINVENRNFTVTNEAIKIFFSKASSFIYPLLFLILFLAYLFIKLLHILFFSLIALIFNQRLKTALIYKQLFNIAIYALVPATILAVAKDLLGKRIIYFGLVYFIVYCTYLFRGIKSTKDA